MRVGLHSVLEEFVLIWLLAKEFTVLLNGEDFHVGVEVLEKTTAILGDIEGVSIHGIVWVDNLDEPDVAAGDGLAACAPPCGGESVVRIIAEVVALLVEYHGLAADSVDTKQVWLVGSVHAPRGVTHTVSLDWAKVANVTVARCLVHMTMTLTWGLEMLASGVAVLFVPPVLVEGEAVLGGVYLWKVLKLPVDEQGRDISCA